MNKKYNRLENKIKNCKDSDIIDRNFMIRKQMCWVTMQDRNFLLEKSDKKQCKYMSNIFYTDSNRKNYYECKK